MIERRLLMKATGVVRRIDDLGRIVIPKEIRRNFKISEGDSLEIFVESNSIILKKFSLLDNTIELAKSLVDLIYKIYNKRILITTKEKIVVTSREDENIYLNKELSNSIKNKILERIDYTTVKSESLVNGGNEVKYYFYPLIINSDAVGSIILLDTSNLEGDKLLIKLITSILVKNIEE